MKITLIPLLGLSLIVSACAGTTLPDDAYAPKGHPEALLSASSERVSFAITDEESINALAKWLESDRPTRAEVSCSAGSQKCGDIQSVLGVQGVPAERVVGAADQVVLVYERVVARPCNPVFVSNHQNPFNLNHPSLGCAISMNAVQMVEDHGQFTDPSLSDPQDAEMGVRNVRRYQGVSDPYYPY
jgi:hypothetical protein